MFKKIVVLFLVVMFTTFISLSNERPIFSSFSNNFDVYTKNSSSNAEIVKADNLTYSLIIGKVGESCKIEGEFDLQQFLEEMKAEIVMVEEFSEGINYYAYTNKIRYLEYVKGNLVNLQVFIGNSGVTVGSPLIFGSF